MESKVLLSAKQRYLPSAVRFGPRLARFVRLNGVAKKCTSAGQGRYTADKTLWLHKRTAIRVHRHQVLALIPVAHIVL